jgi:hypothetical protein
MRILILNQSFHPDFVAVAQFAGDLAAALAAEGHVVTVVASRRDYTDPTICFPVRETWRGWGKEESGGALWMPWPC